MSVKTSNVILAKGSGTPFVIEPNELNPDRLEIKQGTEVILGIEGNRITAGNPEWKNNENAYVTEKVVSSLVPTLISPVTGSKVLKKLAPSTVAISAGTIVRIGTKLKHFIVDTPVTNTDTLLPGNDYSVWVHQDGAAYTIIDNFAAPAQSMNGSVKIGGFHYGLVEIGTTVSSGGFAVGGTGHSWTQADVNKLIGTNEHSIWDLNFRPKCDPRSMACVLGQYWVDIYFCGTEHITQGTSKAGSNVASGTVLPKVPLQFGGNGTIAYSRLSAYEALEIVQSHGKRLITQEEFCSAAYGVIEGQSSGGAAITIPTTLRQNGYTSLIGLEQATGHIWTIGGPLTSVGGSAWTAGPNRGNFYGGAGLPLFGGNRDFAAVSGSRASGWDNVFWYSYWGIGLRAACDHYQRNHY